MGSVKQSAGLNDGSPIGRSQIDLAASGCCHALQLGSRFHRDRVFGSQGNDAGLQNRPALNRHRIRIILVPQVDFSKSFAGEGIGSYI